LQESTDIEKETAEILKDAAELHEDLRNYGNLKDIDKPLVVSGILLALNEMEHKNFSIESLNGDNAKTDGQKIYDAIVANLKRVKVAPDVKRDKILSQFAIIKDTTILNEVNRTLGKTPLRYYTEFLNERIYRCIKYKKSAEDYLGRFYGEFMSYSGGDGQTNDKRISREKIILPINDAGAPDFEYMEQYIKDIEKKKIFDYATYISKELGRLKYEKIPELKEKKWKAFFIGGNEGVFKLRATHSGIDKNKLWDSSIKDIPYITRSEVNNGINLFVGEEQNAKYSIDPQNVITIGLDTQTIFYQPHQFYTGQNIQILTNESINKYNALFIIQLLKIQLQKFNWGGNGATLGRLERTKVMLPINDLENPDYEYMEQYIKNIERNKIKEYLAHMA